MRQKTPLFEDDPAPSPGVPADPEPGPSSDGPISRAEHDELRKQLARTVRRLNRALKRSKAEPEPGPIPEVLPEPKRLGGFLGSIVNPLRKK